MLKYKQCPLITAIDSGGNLFLSWEDYSILLLPDGTFVCGPLGEECEQLTAFIQRIPDDC